MTIAENDAINISKVLTEALPYIRKFNNKVVVIKYGGNAMENKVLQKNFARDLVLMKTVGIHPILVHGGGPQIDFELKKNNINTYFSDSLEKRHEYVHARVEKNNWTLKKNIILINLNLIRCVFY